VTASAGGVNNPSYSHEGRKHHHDNWAQGWYVGAGVNGDVANTNETLYANAPWFYGSFEDTYNFELEDNDVGFDIYVGKRVHRHFAFELGYSWVGDQKFQGFTDGGDPKDPVYGKVEQWNIHAVGLAYWPVAEYFSVFAKGGAAYYSNKTEFSGDDDGVPYFIGDNELSSFAFVYGAGLEIGSDRFGVRGEYTGLATTQANQNAFYISQLVGASLFYRFI
jgi:hypothetical protein